MIPQHFYLLPQHIDIQAHVCAAASLHHAFEQPGAAVKH
jgi:hypothetical protein